MQPFPQLRASMRILPLHAACRVCLAAHAPCRQTITLPHSTPRDMRAPEASASLSPMSSPPRSCAPSRSGSAPPQHGLHQMPDRVQVFGLHALMLPPAAPPHPPQPPTHVAAVGLVLVCFTDAAARRKPLESHLVQATLTPLRQRAASTCDCTPPCMSTAPHALPSACCRALRLHAPPARPRHSHLGQLGHQPSGSRTA